MKSNIEKILLGDITYDYIIKQNRKAFLDALNKLEKTYSNSFKTKDSLRYEIISENLKLCLDEHKEEFNQVDNLISIKYIEALKKLSKDDADHIDWLSCMNFFSETFILQTELTLKKIKLCDELKSEFIKELKDVLEIYSTNEFNLVDELEGSEQYSLDGYVEYYKEGAKDD